MKILWFLWLFVVLPAVVVGQVGFGRSYLKNSRLCHHWNCISTKLGLSDSLPSREESEAVLRRVLPEGPWQDVIDNVLENCYENRTRRFTNTCPGQALMHCVVDQMIDFCPVSSTRQNDSCSPVSSLAGLKYMFSQSRYINLENNLPKERRPGWFLKNYFDTKCCDLPVIFNTTVLEECGFSSFINYYDHGPRYSDVQTLNFQDTAPSTTPVPVFMPFDIPDGHARRTLLPKLASYRPKQHVFMPFDVPNFQNSEDQERPSTTPSPITTTESEDVSRRRLPEFDFSGTPIDVSSDEPTDPLDCCDMTNFINPSWRSECDFHLSFKGQDRLVISSHGPVSEGSTTTTTTERANPIEDLMMVPHNCQKETCVFQMMNIVSDTGILDIDAYIKMLDNFTDTNPAWSKAKARVLTKCVAKPVRSYEAGCEINNMLACTLDVLTENCPYKRKSNICKHGKHDVSCQISSSKYRPKNRREICLLPELIHRIHLQQCGLESLYKVEHVPVPPKTRKHGWFAGKYTCKDSKGPTTCMMTKMGVLNKYNFMDYFKMKDRIRKFTSDQAEWSALLDIYMSAFINIPLYGEHCNSEKKLLNVIDTMLMTCPVSKRKNTAQCNKIFLDMTNTAPDKQNVTKEKLDEIMKHYHHVFMPNQPTTNLNRAVRKKHSRTVKKPVFTFGFLNSQDAPPVNVISLTPEVTTKPSIPPLILKPVYLRPEFGRINDGIFRGGHFFSGPMKATASSFPSHLQYSFGSSHAYSPTTPDYKTTKDFSIAEEATPVPQ